MTVELKTVLFDTSIKQKGIFRREAKTDSKIDNIIYGKIILLNKPSLIKRQFY